MTTLVLFNAFCFSASVCEHIEVVKYLVSEGADVTLQDDTGATAFDVATSEVIKTLIKDNARVR